MLCLRVFCVCLPPALGWCMFRARLLHGCIKTTTPTFTQTTTPTFTATTTPTTTTTVVLILRVLCEDACVLIYETMRCSHFLAMWCQTAVCSRFLTSIYGVFVVLLTRLCVCLPPARGCCMCRVRVVAHLIDHGLHPDADVSFIVWGLTFFLVLCLRCSRQQVRPPRRRRRPRPLRQRQLRNPLLPQV